MNAVKLNPLSKALFLKDQRITAYNASIIAIKTINNPPILQENDKNFLIKKQKKNILCYRSAHQEQCSGI